MRVLLTVAIAYLVMCLTVYLIQTRLIFFAERGYDHTPADVGMEFQDIRFKASDGVTLAAWYVPCPEPIGTAIFFHGNAGNISHRLTTIRILREMRLNVFILDYRGYGESEGSPTEQGLYKDAEASWKYVTEQLREKPGRIVLVGRSLGGGVAIDLAHRHQPGALVVESTFTSIVHVAAKHYRFLPVELMVRHRFESIRKIPDIKCPKLFLHGTDDWLIPIDMARRLYGAAAEPKRFIETPGGHNEAGFSYSDEYTDQTRRWIEQALTSPATMRNPRPS